MDVPVLELFGTAPAVAAVVVLGAGVALAAQTRRFLARLRLVVGQDVARVLPLGVVVQQAALLVERVRRQQVAIAVLLGLRHIVPLIIVGQ